MGILVSKNGKDYDVDDILDEIAASSEERQIFVRDICNATNFLVSFSERIIDWNKFGETILQWHEEIFGEKLPPECDENITIEKEDYDDLPF